MKFPSSVYIYISGQIIATSHDRFPPNGGLVREIPENFREIVWLVKYYSIWPDIYNIPGTLNIRFFIGCFNWMIPNLYIKDGCFTKHPL